MNWVEKVQKYCADYNIPIEYLVDTLYEPKVVPMIRGKAFEFSVMLALQQILSPTKWDVVKPAMNAQLGLHDTDVRVIHKPTRIEISVECKLADKESYRLMPNGHSRLQVKCMRSRTLGIEMVRELAPKWKVSPRQLTVHNDQYRPGDFDVVITSIGNVFYRTKDDGRFEWQPTAAEEIFLNSTGGNNTNTLKEFAFFQMYAARARDLAVSRKNAVQCTRRKCEQKNGCGFIPNYPVIEFEPNNPRPLARWQPIADIETLLLTFVRE
jgi:hypothetical protein